MPVVSDHEWPREEADILKSVFAGKADAAMQRRAISYLVEVVCGINQVGFDPDNVNMTIHLTGRKWVARQIQNAITIPLDRLTGESHERRSSGDGPADPAAGSAGGRINRAAARRRTGPAAK